MTPPTPTSRPRHRYRPQAPLLFLFFFACGTLELMRLITGPPGSGKTALILDEFRQALRAHNDAIRLLVPTRTLAQHLQNRIAREGFVFPPDRIQTLGSFISLYTVD